MRIYSILPIVFIFRQELLGMTLPDNSGRGRAGRSERLTRRRQARAWDCLTESASDAAQGGQNGHL